MSQGFRASHALVPVAFESDDELSFAERAARAAATIVRASGAPAKLTLCTVRAAVDGPSDRAKMSEASLDAYRAILEGRARWADRELARLSDLVRSDGLEVATTVLPDRHGVAREIADGAKALGVDLIVLPTHARKGVERLFLGSVAQKVAHLSTIPVLLLPPEHA